jgi:phosphoribosylglycinamide formyltransferase-1
VAVDVVRVLASKPDIGAVAHAQAFGVPVVVVGPESPTASLEELGRNTAVLAGWLRRVRNIPEGWVGRAINIHPSLLPLFGGKGFFGRHVHEAVLASGMRVSGCTVHFVTRDYDAGPVIVQRACPVLPDDDANALAARVFAEETVALPEALALVIEGRARLSDGKTVFTS